MDSYSSLLILCLLIVLSYAFDFVARKTRFPSVVLLMGVGVIAQFLIPKDFQSENIASLLQVLGTVGLILIVLEGGMDIHINKDKKKLILRSLLASFVVLLASSFALAGVLYVLVDASFYNCFVNAVPLSVISSAIAIPSAAALAPQSKEFVVYESTFSDILGIILFNFVTTNKTMGFEAFGKLSWQIVAVVILSVVFSLLLFKMIEVITHKVKFFLILALLLIMYILGKQYMHLPTLLMVFLFGLLMSNRELFIIPQIKKYFNTHGFDTHFKEFFLITSESAFIIRTFFFVAFGFFVPLDTLTKGDVLLLGLLAFGIILLVRYIYMLISKTEPLNILTLIAPRGLITILLFLQLPDYYKIPDVGLGVLFIVICLSLAALTAGTMLTGGKKKIEGI
jgi:NhaP-type Na+/H+ or K+/H+ antiporter